MYKVVEDCCLLVVELKSIGYSIFKERVWLVRDSGEVVNEPSVNIRQS